MRTAIVYNFLAEATLMASIAILLMLPIRRLLRKSLGSRALCFGWLLVAIRLLCPLTLPNPIIHEIRSPFAADEAIRPIAGQLKVRFSDAAFEAYQWTRRAVGVESDLAERMGAFVDDTANGMLSIHVMQLYLIGLILVLAWFVLSNVRFRRRLKADRIEPISGQALETYRALCERHHQKPLPVWYVDPLPSACLVGVLRPYIALPLTAKPQDLEQVLHHEMCHYRARDHWWGVVRLACCAVHWFNPLVWLAASMSRTDQELACDERVSAQLDEAGKKAYAGVLVLAASKRDMPGLAVLSTGMSMTGRKLKSRVGAILRGNHVKKGLVLAFVLLSSMALVGAFATSEAAFPLAMPSYNEEVLRAGPVIERLASPEDEEKAIDFAKSVWQNPYVAEDTQGMTWRAQQVSGHIEVLAATQDGKDALNLAFTPDGRIIYLCNLLCGPTESFAVDTPRYTDTQEKREEIYAFGVRAMQALNGNDEDAFPDKYDLTEGQYDSEHLSVYVGFPSPRADEGYNRTLRVQVEPESKLIYYCNYQFFTDTDRLEPGNG